MDFSCINCFEKIFFYFLKNSFFFLEIKKKEIRKQKVKKKMRKIISINFNFCHKFFAIISLNIS